MNVITPEVEKKAWGLTRCTHLSDNTLVFHASVVAGGYCSEHYHMFRYNDFYVLSGTLLVIVFDKSDGQVSTEYALEAGQRMTVPPGIWHYFLAVTPVELLETYWLDAAKIAPDDIVRRSIGGVK